MTKKTEEIKAPGFDKQAKEIQQLTPLERQVLDLRSTNNSKGKPHTYDEIAKIVFKGKKTRQTVYDMILRAERKIWRLQAKERYAENPGDCPVDEVPLPARIRHSLKEAGFGKLGQIAGKSRVEISKIEGIGRHGSFQVYGLLQAWGVRKPHSYCVNCGTPLSRKLADEVTVKCGSCGTVVELHVTREPELAEARA